MKTGRMAFFGLFGILIVVLGVCGILFDVITTPKPASPQPERQAVLAAPQATNTTQPQVIPTVAWCDQWTITENGVPITFDLVEGKTDDRLSQPPYHLWSVSCEGGKIKVIISDAADNCDPDSIVWFSDGSYTCLSLVARTLYNGLAPTPWWPQGEPK